MREQRTASRSVRDAKHPIMQFKGLPFLQEGGGTKNHILSHT